MNSFIGNQPATSFESPKKQVSTSNSGTTITLDYPVTSVADIRLTINAVVQSYDNYSVSGSTLTVGGTLNNDRVEILFVGRTYGSIVPSDASVGLNQLSATGTPSSSNFLRGDNAWAIPSGGKILQVEQVTEATQQTINSSSTWVALTDMTDTITTSSGSSVLIILDTNVYVDNNIGYSIRITFNHSGISETDVYVDSATNTAVLHNGITRVNTNNTLIIKHSPSTTNEITYKAYARNSGESYFNSTRTSSLTLMEIGS